MNYEEKYKRALERAKERYSACSAPALLEYIFPELKENEDERIRKAIICGMNALKENQKSETFATIPIDDCIDWLEKQGHMLDADKVIAWLVGNICDFEYYVKRFKQDFGL